MSLNEQFDGNAPRARALAQSMLDRRQFVTGVGALGALTLPSASGLALDRRAVSPASHGAVGNGAADDTRAVQEALVYAFNHGLAVDGGKAVFAVRGDILVTGALNPWVKSLRLIQLSPSDERKTLHFAGCERIRIDGLRIDVGRSRNRGYMNQSGGLWIDGGSNHAVRNVEVFGDGKNSLITIWNTANSSYENLLARDARYDAPEAKDDVLQGIFLCRNSKCIVRSAVVSNLSGNASTSFPTRFSRGIVLCGNVQVTVVDATVLNVDQGIDVTGTDGNRGCAVLGAHTSRCNTVGVKLANSAVGCRVVDSVADRCGLMGFFASGPSEANLRYKTQDCDFIRCVAIDSGYNGFHDSAPHAGFRVERNRFDQAYPAGIRFIDCRAIDRQPVKTMEYGFYVDVRNNGATLRPNELINCRSEGHIRSARFGPWAAS